MLSCFRPEGESGLLPEEALQGTQQQQHLAQLVELFRCQVAGAPLQPLEGGTNVGESAQRGRRIPLQQGVELSGGGIMPVQLRRVGGGP